MVDREAPRKSAIMGTALRNWNAPSRSRFSTNRSRSALLIALIGFPMAAAASCSTCANRSSASLLKAFEPNIHVRSVRQSPAKGFWEVSFDTGKKKGVVYIDYSKKHLFTGSLIQIAGKKNLTQNRLSELNKVDVSKIPLKDALVLGSTYAKKKVIVFDDPE